MWKRQIVWRRQVLANPVSSPSLRTLGRAYGLKVALLDGLEDRQGEPTEADKAESDLLDESMLTKLRSMRFIWRNYHEYAWGRDELKPISRRGHDNWGGMGVTLVDSLDTLWLMGLKEEFWQAGLGAGLS